MQQFIFKLNFQADILFAGKLLPWKLDVPLLRASSVLTSSRRMLELTDPRMTGRLPFTLGLKILVYPQYYHCLYSYQTKEAYECDAELVGLGKTSAVFEVRMRDAKTEEILIKQTVIGVYVHPRTRRPVAHPQKVYDQFDERLKIYKAPKLVRLELPTNVKLYHHSIVTTHSDCDRNRHTNRAIYIRYAMDTGTRASTSGFYNNFKGDLMKYKIKELIVLYRGETRPGTRADVYTWEDQNDDKKLHFKIMNNGENINDCTICFYPLAESKL